MDGEIIPFEPHARKTEIRGEVRYLARPERVKAIKEQLHFYPHSNDEASRAANLMGRQHQLNPTLAHLDEVYKRQRSIGADPRSTLRSIVHKFEEYASSAVNELYYMETFADVIEEVRPNPLASFNTLFPVEQWQQNGEMRASFTSLARHIETAEFAETEQNDRLGSRELIDNTSNDERVSRIVSTLGTLRASSLQRTAQAVRVSQEHRLNFWMDQLEASRSHLFVRALASTALHDLRKVLDS